MGEIYTHYNLIMLVKLPYIFPFCFKTVRIACYTKRHLGGKEKTLFERSFQTSLISLLGS